MFFIDVMGYKMQFFRMLIELFKVCEDLENIDGHLGPGKINQTALHYQKLH